MSAARKAGMALLAMWFLTAHAFQMDEPTKKLGAFLGRWNSEGTLAGGEKVLSTLECRWSPQGAFLLCEQTIQRASGPARQLTVYSYNASEKTYAYTTLANPGARPTSGIMEIKGDVWSYHFSYEAAGKAVQMHITNDFTKPATEIFKVESSEDGGAHWRTVLEGAARKVAD